MTFLLYRIKSGAGRGALPPRPIHMWQRPLSGGRKGIMGSNSEDWEDTCRAMSVAPSLDL